jgi:hypothetical protein
MKNQIRRLVCTALVLAIFSCYGLPAYAWGEDGHRIVAMIAEQNIDPATATQIHLILGDGVSLADVARQHAPRARAGLALRAAHGLEHVRSAAATKLIAHAIFVTRSA